MRRAVLVALGFALTATAHAGATVYVSNYGPATISTFSSGVNGALSPLGSPVPTSLNSSNANQIAISADGRYLYATNSADGTVAGFAIGSGGGLTSIGTPVPSGKSSASSPVGIATSPDGTHLYVANYANGDGTVTAFSIDAGGALTALGSVQSGTSAASQPYSPIVSPDGRYLYVTNGNQHSISTFRIAADGTISQVGTPVGTTVALPTGIAETPDGSYLFVAEVGGLGTVEPFSIGPDGRPVADGGPVSSGQAPAYLAVSPDGQHLYSANQAGGTVSTFLIGPTGVPAPVGSAVAGGAHPDGIAVSPDGKNLYMANNLDGTVSTYALAADGTPAAVGSAVPSGTSADGVAISPDPGPVAAFASPQLFGLTRTFDASSSVPGSTPIHTYIWDFGDKTYGSGVTSSHTYAAPGTYTVKLTVAGANGCSTSGLFAGQSAFCRLDPAASTSQTITVSLSHPTPAEFLRVTSRSVSRKTGAITLGVESSAPPVHAVATFTEPVHRRVGRHTVNTHRTVTFGTATGTTRLVIKPGGTARSLLRSRHTLTVTIVLTAGSARTTTKVSVKLH